MVALASEICKEIEIGKFGVTELTQIEPVLERALNFKRFLLRFDKRLGSS